jgi:hypothetical protein
VLDGTERLERYRRLDDSGKSDYALIQLETSRKDSLERSI